MIGLESTPANLPVVLVDTLKALAIGPAVSLGLFVYGPSRTLLNWEGSLTLVFMGCLIPIAWILSRRGSRECLSKKQMSFFNLGREF